MKDFDLEIDGNSEEHVYAIDLIKNLLEVAQKDGLQPQILMEVAMFYSVGFNLVNGDPNIVRELLENGLEQLQEEDDFAGQDEVWH